MTRFGNGMRGAALLTLATFASLPASDLSRYRAFQLGSDLPTVAKQTGTGLSQVKIVHSRPVLIQELGWRPPHTGPSAGTEPRRDVVFSFYQGELFRIAINYDRYETEGLTVDDFVEAISAMYGTAVKPATSANGPKARYSDDDQVVAQWQDSQYRFDLMRSSYGSRFILMGSLKRLEKMFQTASIEGTRLDHAEAPKREAERVAKENEAEKSKLEKARVENKPKFRP